MHFYLNGKERNGDMLGLDVILICFQIIIIIVLMTKQKWTDKSTRFPRISDINEILVTCFFCPLFVLFGG